MASGRCGAPPSSHLCPYQCNACSCPRSDSNRDFPDFDPGPLPLGYAGDAHPRIRGPPLKSPCQFVAVSFIHDNAGSYSAVSPIWGHGVPRPTKDPRSQMLSRHDRQLSELTQRHPPAVLLLRAVGSRSLACPQIRAPSGAIGKMVSVNSKGNQSNLFPAHPGNQNAVRSGAFSRTGRPLAPRAEEIATELMRAPHVVDLDRVAAEEIGQLVALIEAIDCDIAERGLRSRRSLFLRLRASGRLEKWLGEFGATPQSRAQWAATLAGTGLVDEIRRRRTRTDDD
jgi:hypothetical protein